MTISKNSQSLLLEVFVEVPKLDKNFIVSDFAEAAFINSEKLMQNRTNHHINLKSNVLKKLNNEHFNGQRILDVASSTLCAAKQLDEGTAKVSRAVFCNALKEQAKKQHLDMLRNQEKIASGEITIPINEPITILNIFSNPAIYRYDG